VYVRRTLTAEAWKLKDVDEPLELQSDEEPEETQEEKNARRRRGF
jgi:hypothetical protein